MKKLIYNLKRFWYKISFNGEGRAMYVHEIKGKFRAKYPDGQISQKMSYRCAKDYTEMFGGIVIDAF